MTDELRILILEDVPIDAELMERVLRKAGFAFLARRVDTREAFEQALDAFKPDIVLSDYNLPAFTGREALQIVRRTHPEIPVIIVTGSLGDEAAVELVHQGARDYVLKNNLLRLGPAVERALATEEGIRARKAAERAQRAAEAKYRAIFAEARDGIVLMDADSGRIVDCNPEFERMCGRPFAQLRDMCIWELRPPDKQAAAQQLFGNIRETGQGGSSDFELQRPDGTLVEIDFLSKRIQINERPCIQSIVRDITERRAVEKALQESEEKLRLIVEHSNNLFYSHTPEHVLTYVSPQSRQFLDCAPEEAMVRWTEFVTDNPVNALGVELTQRAIDSGEQQPVYELEIKTHLGRKLWVEIHETPVVRDGKTIAIAGALVDITQRKQAEAVLKETLDRIKTQLEAIGQISMSESLIAGEVEQFAREVTETVARVAGVERANVWLFNDDESELRCIDLYEAAAGRHAAGIVLKRAQFEHEFRSIISEKFVNADDPLTDPRTAGYVEGYLKPLHITSMLDALIHVSGRNLGLLCFEHVDQPHHWEQDEITFASQLADKIALTVINRERRLAEDEAMVQRDKAQHYLDIAGVMLLALDREGRVSLINRRGCELLGYSEAEIVGQNWFERFLPAHCRTDVRDIFDRITDDGPVEFYENRIVTRNGEERLIAWHNRVLTDEAGKVVGTLSSGDDITERKQAETELRLFRTLLDNSNDYVEVIDPITLRFLDVNEKECRDLGYSREELLSMSVHDIDPRFDTAAMEMIDRQIRETGAAIFKSVHRRRDGSIFPVEISLKFVDLGRTYILSIARDITERNRGEEMLRASRDLLSSIVENLPIRVFWKDAELRYLGCNTLFARDAGMSHPEELLGKDDFQMGWRGQAELYRADDKRVMTSDTPKLGFEEPQTTPDGSTIWLRTSKVPLHDADGKVFGMVGIYDDITERKQMEDALRRSNRALKTLSAGNMALVHASDEKALLQEMCRVVVETGGYHAASVYAPRYDDQKSVAVVASVGADPEYIESLGFTWDDSEKGQGTLGRAIRSGTPQVAQNIQDDASLAPWYPVTEKLGCAAALSLPMKGPDGKVLYVLSICAAEAGAFKEDETRLLQELADDLTYGMLALRQQVAHEQLQQEHLKSVERLKESLTETIRAIALTVEKRDPYTAGHQARVAQLAAAIAGELGLDAERIEGLQLGGLIHDIGKVYVPAEILNRPGRLTATEFEMIKTHPEVGYDIIKDVKFPWPVADMILQHHERMDGSGYPKGLKGEDIILEARILAVADVVEAMSAHRPYRPAIGVEAGLAEIESKRGQGFDADVVDACLRLFREKGYVLADVGAGH